MEFWESGNFEEFRKEVIKTTKKKSIAILEEAERRAKEIEENARKEAEKIKEERLNAALKQLEEEFSAKRKEIETAFERRVNETIENFKELVFLQVLEKLDFIYLFECFKKRVLEKHKTGRFLVSCRLKGNFPDLECTDEKGVLFKFEGENVAVLFDESELMEVVEAEVQKLLREV
ncbi:hypothetical protein SAMN06265339_0491 [Desulfurobacterium pacificum]|uniref:V-type ATP synthase subunit E n=1 Tax=Desulfurobacterium pacificum TaxID=240166 RepID=A0ABY1NEM1_9BACT|nr:hypothetical protein [Desulfurobacterium pacificum]SMP07528.1 hypothetical protein SAMN06265339_0491 [Desulfurobacterium pacificum]